MRTILLTLLAAYQCYAATPGYYKAAVVELNTPFYGWNYPVDDIMVAGARTVADYAANASALGADIIVFPEGGLHGKNMGKSIVMPSPEEKETPCTNPTKYHQALVLVSCAAKKYNIYIVINNGEQYFNSSSNKTEYYNTNVAFDRNGTVVARYRKFNPYGEPVTKPALDLHTFTTDFNVTFGMFTCFDIDFEEPGVVLARDYGVKHFIFPHCWISELPFLTAIQAQWGFAYSLDVVLLASGCNSPSQGGTGSGIYLGRQGALDYFQTNDVTSRLIVASVPTSFDTKAKVVPSKSQETINYKEASKVLTQGIQDVEVHLLDDQRTNSSLFLLRDYTDVYNSQPLLPPGSLSSFSGNDTLALVLQTDTSICQGSLCCDFSVMTSSIFSSFPLVNATPRGDDFSRLYYRLAAFDGVRWYGGGLATGGVQICGVISCANASLSSCGLRSDDPSAQVATYGPLLKLDTEFLQLRVTGRFSYNRTFIYPDILTTGSGSDFGALLPSSMFNYEISPPANGSVVASLTLDPVSGLVSAALYARQFDRDGQKRTELPTANIAHHPYSPHGMVALFVLFLLFANCLHSWIN